MKNAQMERIPLGRLFYSLEQETGLEPATFSLATRCSTS